MCVYSLEVAYSLIICKHFVYEVLIKARSRAVHVFHVSVCIFTTSSRAVVYHNK